MADLGAKHTLLPEGVGWGNMPIEMVAEDIRTGRLVRLNLPEAMSTPYQFHAVHRTDTPPGPAASWLVERLLAQVTP